MSTGGLRPRQTGIVFALLFAALAATPLRATEINGWFTGTLACEAITKDPPYQVGMTVEMKNGAFSYVEGLAGGERRYRSLVGVVDHKGDVLVTGAYWGGNAYKPIALNGHADGNSLAASGRAGTRRCDLTLTALPRIVPEPLMRTPRRLIQTLSARSVASLQSLHSTVRRWASSRAIFTPSGSIRTTRTPSSIQRCLRHARSKSSRLKTSNRTSSVSAMRCCAQTQKTRACAPAC
jgi:hypothetical protein